MKKVDRLERLRPIAERAASTHGLEIFDVQFRREAVGWVLRVIIDRRGAADTEARAGEPVDSVGVDDCRRVSQDLSALLDVEDAIDRAYTLEVTSPGLDRPLRGVADYERFRGRLAQFVTTEPVGGQTHFRGRLQGIEDGEVVLAEGARTHRIPLGAVSRARLEIEFGHVGPGKGI
ncbi:MAG: ribosome maturation factor RimP [Acidobacteria bacterium]|nr:MAG: ribosome maturation factor RimP [Acidobacteriota bacterium]